MTTTVNYSGVGKSLLIDGSTFFTFYGQDFNPNIPSFPSGWNSVTTSGETSYNLSGFQVGNEVCCGAFVFSNNSTTDSISLSWTMDFEKSGNGVNYYPAGWSTSGGGSTAPSSLYAQYYYAGIDDDEIWLGETYYRFHIERTSSDGSSGTINIPFTISNLDFDDNLHTAGYLWIEGNYLCYIDGTRNGSGYKHKINYDTGYNGGSGTPGYLWIPSSSSDNHIYYTSAGGTVRRTHISSSWYGGNYAPAGAKTGMIWVSDGDYTEGYGYLCYVNGAGQLRRMGNGTP